MAGGYRDLLYRGSKGRSLLGGSFKVRVERENVPDRENTMGQGNRQHDVFAELKRCSCGKGRGMWGKEGTPIQVV